MTRTPGYQLHSKSLLLDIFATLYKNNLFEAPTLISISEKYKKLLTYIQTHYREQITLEEISKFCNMSPKYFCRYFKNNFGKTFVNYLNHFRIEKACVQLSETSDSIIKIALDNGFHNISYFNKCFKSIMHVTPSLYRKQFNQELP